MSGCNDFKFAGNDNQLTSPCISVARASEQIDKIVVDFNQIQGRPVLEWWGGVLTITFDRSAEVPPQ